MLDRRAGRKGLFTAALERALLENRVDIAVHSAKDLPSTLDRGVSLAATLPRGSVEDCFISKASMPPGSLEEGVTIATSSVRRARQIRWIHRGVTVVPLRGNVPTRLRKFGQSNWDAIVLARAGLERLGFSPPQFQFEESRLFAGILPIGQFVPAAGQGIIAVQIRAEDTATRELVSAIDDRKTHLSLLSEREFVRLLEADCDWPVGAFATVVDDNIELRVQVFGDAVVPKMAMVMGHHPEEVGAEAFSKINGF